MLPVLNSISVSATVTRVCNHCRVEKPVGDFHKANPRCKPCQSVAHRRWYKDNPDKAWASRIKSRYGLTPGHILGALELQDACCFICRHRFIDISDICVDHDEPTGIKRGLLCRPCNMALGLFKHNVAALEAASAYLRVYESYIGEQGT